MGKATEAGKFLMKDGVKDCWEGITNSDSSAVDRVSKGVLGLASIGIGATVGLIGLGVNAAKKASEKNRNSFCTECGSNLLENTNFCVKCGCEI